ncbi:MAG: GTPase Era [Conexibacter sp.]|jgi:GTP-binding protein Era|nr:GTPase Era [Conexibacter sp.]MDX6717218.1 GTPase [Baekduia sp.]MDX6731725.1 GTPase [Baekduia sp.]
MVTTRAGLIALAGRPNVGKSTLVNAIVGSKVAIVSDKPQTTRRAIRGVVSRPDAQLVLTDLPGVQKPLDRLTERMQRRVERELAETDVALMVLNAEQGVGPGDRWIANALKNAPCPVVIAVNKVDRLDRAHIVLALEAAGELGVADEIFPISARKGTGVEALTDHLFGLMPDSPFLFDAGESSDLSPYVHLAELIREQVLRRTFQEVPHAVEVIVEEVETDRDDLTVVHARVWVETESQKGILVGSGGKMIRNIGTGARKELERELGTKVHLDLIVRVRRGWRGDESLLDRLGFDS